mgnify:CR=1 FL=1
MESLAVANNNYLKKLSKRDNKSEGEILEEALKLYENYNSLMQEMNEWDLASDEDLELFEKNLK